MNVFNNVMWYIIKINVIYYSIIYTFVHVFCDIIFPINMHVLDIINTSEDIRGDDKE